MVTIARILYVSEFNQGIEGMHIWGIVSTEQGGTISNLEIFNSEALLTSVFSICWMDGEA